MVQPQIGRSGIGIVHVHSDYSHDGRDSLERLRAVSLERGISFIGMTDHAEDFTPAQYLEYRARCGSLSDERLSIIPGLEYRFGGYPGLHLLAFGLSEMIDPATPEAFCQLTRERTEFTMVAHPVLPAYSIPDTVAATLDAIEVWNAAYNTRYLPDVRAIRLYHEIAGRRPEVVAIAGLDQHDSRNDRETRVVLENPMADKPLAELKAGRFTNRGRTMTFDAHARFSEPRLKALSLARWSLDRVNTMHEKVMHLLPARNRGRR
jgi:hypothetical protein